MNKQLTIRFITLIFITVLIGFFRVISHKLNLGAFANFTPIGAMALFGGAYFKSYDKAFLFPIATLFMSDLILMQLIYPEHSTGLLYKGWYWTYLAFALVVLIGRFIKKVNVKSVVISAVAAALVHWVIADFGVWLGGGMNLATGKPYPPTFNGLMECYMMAIPFMKNLLLGNLIYGAILFGSFELAQLKYPSLLKPAYDA